MKNNKKILGAGLCLSVLLFVAACSSDKKDDATEEKKTDTEKSLEISDVWSRTTTDGQTVGAVYLTIVGGSEDDALVDAMVPTTIAGDTQIHETKMGTAASDTSSTTMMDDTTSTTAMMDDTSATSDTTSTTVVQGGMSAVSVAHEGEDHANSGEGTMTMKEVDQIDIPAGETVMLKPGGYHIMMFDLVKPLVAGDTFEVTLTFEQAGTKTLTAEVRDA